MASHSVYLCTIASSEMVTKEFMQYAEFGQYHLHVFQTRTQIVTQYPKSNLAQKKNRSRFCICMLSFVHLTAVPASRSSDAGSPRVCALLQGTSPLSHKTPAATATPKIAVDRYILRAVPLIA